MFLEGKGKHWKVRLCVIYTVPVKCKLTVTRNSNDSTRTSILETRKLRVSSLESSLSSRVVLVSSRGDKELIARLFFFQIHVLVNLAGLLLTKEKKFESRI